MSRISRKQLEFEMKNNFDPLCEGPRAGVQNMCHRVSTAARHFFDQVLFHDLHDFYMILRDFT